MPRFNLVKTWVPEVTFRTEAVKSSFTLQDVKLQKQFIGEIPIEDDNWKIGLIVGRSGTGKTRYIFYISGFCNFALIIPFWILAKLNLVTASFENVMVLFVIVFAADLIITYFLVRRVLNRISAVENSFESRVTRELKKEQR